MKKNDTPPPENQQSDDAPVVGQCTICHRPLSWRDVGKEHCRNCRNRLVDLAIRKGVPATEMRPVTVTDPETKEARIEVQKVRRQPGPPKALPGSLRISNYTARPHHMRNAGNDKQKPVIHHIVGESVKQLARPLYASRPPAPSTPVRRAVTVQTSHPHTQPAMALTHRQRTAPRPPQVLQVLPRPHAPRPPTVKPTTKATRPSRRVA